MKPFKFKIWHKRRKQWCEDAVIDRNGIYENGRDFEDYTSDDNLEMVLFTGLNDKNGKEIYEGDILRFPPKDWQEERDFIGYEVFYHDNDCADNHIGFQMNRMRFYGNLCGGECKAKMLPKYTSQMEIIGNIYETPNPGA